MLSWIFMDFVFQYYHKAHKNIAYSIENSLRQPAAKFFPQKGANLKSKKAHCALETLWTNLVFMLKPAVASCLSQTHGEMTGFSSMLKRYRIYL